MNAQFVLRQIGYILCAIVGFAILLQLFGRFNTQIINSIHLQLSPSQKAFKAELQNIPSNRVHQPKQAQPKIGRIEQPSPSEMSTILSYCTKLPAVDAPVCGKQFSRDWLPYLEKFGLTDAQTAKITVADDKETMKLTPKFVTAFSDNHYNDAKRTLLKGFAKHLPNEQLIVYNLGLKMEYITELKSNPQVTEVREIKWNKYPDHVKNLFGYHWKPLLIAEFLQEHNAIFYMDAHISWNTGDIGIVKKKISCNLDTPNACDHYPLMLMWNTGHSIFATTKEDMYQYFPVEINGTKSLEMGCAGYQLTYGTSDVRKNILKWVVLCALEKNCMAPSGVNLICKWGANQYDYFANCHRYDQSAFNILLANRHQYNRSKYFYAFNIEPPKSAKKN